MNIKQYLPQSRSVSILSALLALCCQSSMAIEQASNTNSSAKPTIAQTNPGQEAQQGSQWELLPSKPQNLMPYLEGVFILGNQCKQGGAMFEGDAISESAQKVKTAVSEIGVNYDLTLNFNYANINSSASGNRTDFAGFNASFLASWTLARDTSGDQGVFLTLNVDYGKGFNFNQNKSDVTTSIGSISLPQSSNRGGNGAYIPHLVLGYSGFEGKFVVTAGVLDLSAIFDLNSYSGNWCGNLMNESFNFSPVLPLSSSGLGYVVAWQPNESFYMMNSSTATNALPNHNPFDSLSSDHWTNITELGFIFEDSLGLGAGTYRLQYAHTEFEGGSGSSVGINVEQQLGQDSPVGFFTRWGISDQQAASYTGTQQAVTAGFVLQAPFSSKGWGSNSNNEQVALGFLWQKAADSQKPSSHSSEYGIELSAVIQITPTFFLQPDIQFIKNPIHSGDRDSECIMQIQGVFCF